ncbi:alpha/beta fold hydrolase [Methylovirgula sp. 4M-Z18]|uniref:alpha/beta fold hydrolase n=1 Tax=Methylovirgula sp. 4M-Z18 TaxID=2293567 RepID=UPI000E2E7160|nr:alpha/beta hydrolase [Methylovirgula sp. 4M-Z18]RFB80636.1 alpha/beta hydrolase [Methylovirgula sp. 4M-Z18]
MPNSDPAFTSRFVLASDGLRLHVRDYGPRDSDAIPVVCLAGLTRNSADFDALALALSQGKMGNPRRVLALDYRGRGLSDWDAGARYDMTTENADILSVLDACEVGRAVFVGTSRGGLHAMVLAVTRPTVLHAVVLNDVGPVIEAQGLARIKTYVGKLPPPRDWADALDLVKRMNAQMFPAIGDDAWRIFLRQTFEEKDGRLSARYDPRLADTLKDFDIEKPLPDLWPQFEALKGVPLLALRGANSDLLAQNTLEEMQKRHPNCAVHLVDGEAHAPLLLDTTSIGSILEFVVRVDA